jgi:hypothetical protein
MKFVALDEHVSKKPLITFYSGKNYTGESQELPVGLYNLHQLTIGAPQSLKLAKQATYMAVEKADGTGARMTATEDVPDISAILSFTPAVFGIASNVEAYNADNELVATLLAGGYPVSTLREKGARKLVVPEGLIVRFSSGDSDAKSFKDGEVALDEGLLKFSDLSVILMWDQSADLSDVELAMVAGGKGACGAKVCGAAVGGACGAQVCGAALIPGLPVSP